MMQEYITHPGLHPGLGYLLLYLRGNLDTAAATRRYSNLLLVSHTD